MVEIYFVILSYILYFLIKRLTSRDGGSSNFKTYKNWDHYPFLGFSLFVQLLLRSK